jgi:putative ABC transport system permease protein
MNPEPRPPRVAEWILKRVVPPGVAGESILGDLHQSFSEAIRSRGPLLARAYYWTDVLRIASHRRRHAGRVQPVPETRHNGPWLNALAPDARLALRMLVKRPVLTVVGGLGLAVAIAIATGLFAVMRYYYSDPPVEGGDRVVSVDYLEDDSSRSTLFDYRLWKEELKSIEHLAAYRIIEDRDLRGRMVVAGLANIAEITASAFRVARVPPLLGRPLLDSDELEGANRVLVIGCREWHQRFGADPAVVGRELRIDGIAHTVVGVMPEGFRLPVNNGFWTPLATGRGVAPGAPGAAAEGTPRISVFGRLASGVEPGAAQAEVAVIGERMIAEYPQIYERLRPVVQPYIRHLLDIPPWAIWLLQLNAGLILIVVAVNVAVLFYARTALRRVEITVRTALGASRRRIVTQLFVEALALSALATALGLLIAQAGLHQVTLVDDFQDERPYWFLEGLTPATILYAAGIAALTAVVVGVIPALQATGRHVQSTLREMGGGTGLRLGKTWTALICAQVAVAVGALPAVVGVAWNYVPPPTPTFPASEILELRSFRPQPVSPLRGSIDSSQARAAYGSLQAELLRRVEAMPEVAGVTFTGAGGGVRIEVGDPVVAAGSNYSGTLLVGVDYFGVLGVPVLAGRTFDRNDAVDGAIATIVNRAFADTYFAGRSAVGQRFREGPWDQSERASRPWFEVVGVVENMETPSRGRRPVSHAYHPIALGTEPRRLVARTRGIAAASIVPRVREIAAELAPGAVLAAGAMDSYYASDPVQLRLVRLMVAVATLSVLLLSAAGISAMMSFAVTRRQREIGIRAALGASRGQVVASIFWRSARQLGSGLLIGVGLAILLDRLAGGDMAGGELAPVLAFVTALVLLSGLLATLGPARRALRIQPTEAMRER